MSAEMHVPEDLVLVGHISGAFGIQGWVKIRPYSADADAMFNARQWWLNKPELHEIACLEVKPHGEDVLARLRGVADRNAAEALKGSTVSISRQSFPPLEDGEFYWVDLMGLSVQNLQGEVLGVIRDLMDNGAHPILRVAAAEVPEAELHKHERLIPFVDQFVKQVDLQGKSIQVDWGLDF